MVHPELDIEQLILRIRELVCRSDLDRHEHHNNSYDEIYRPTSPQLKKILTVIVQKLPRMDPNQIQL